MAMNIDAFALQRLSQWFSANYPVGSYAYSHGLESAISQGLVTGGPNFDTWLRDIVTLGGLRNDIILLAQAYRGTDPLELTNLANALGAGAERVKEANAQGTAFAGVTGTDAYPYPVAVGCAAQAEGLPLETTALFYAQGFASNLVTIACRAIPIGASEGQTILRGVAPLIEERTRQGLDATLDDLGGFAPLGDIASILHETQNVRVFRT